MTKDKATKVADKFNALYFTTTLSDSVLPASVEGDSEGDFDVIISSSNSRTISHSAMRSAWKVCSLYHLMMFIQTGFFGLKIVIHS